MVRIQEAKGAAVIIGFMLASPALSDARKDAMAANARGDYLTHLRIVVPLANNGVAWAQNEIGAAYELGHNTNQDYAEAAKWY